MPFSGSLIATIIGFILFVIILVGVHELGHFLAARMVGIKVERFSLGIGKVLFSCKDKRGTEFVLSLLPLGGYVKMYTLKGQNIAERSLEGANNEITATDFSEFSENNYDQTFESKSILARAWVIFAGPFFNLVFAFILYWIISLQGTQVMRPVIAEVTPSSIAATAGVSANSEIVAVDGKTVQSFTDIATIVGGLLGNTAIDFELKPLDFAGANYHKKLDLSKIELSKNSDIIELLGIIPPVLYKTTNVFAKIIPDSNAQRSGLRVGDEMLQINGKDASFELLRKQISDGATVLNLKIKRDNRTFDKNISLTANKDGKILLGIAPEVVKINQQYVHTIKYNMFSAIPAAWKQLVNVTQSTYRVLINFISGGISVDNLAGPVGIAKFAGQSLQFGVMAFIGFLALMSVNLGLLNLVPLPILDGGHLLLLVIEKIKGSPISEKLEQIIVKISMILLLSLFLFTFFNDLYS